MEYEAYLHLIRQVDELIASFEEHPDEATRERVGVLLAGLDALHREGLTRLADRLRGSGAGEVLDHAASDPVVRVLLGLYDLAELDLPEEPEPAAAAVGFVPVERLTMRRSARAEDA